jgi:hypothetical protein
MQIAGQICRWLNLLANALLGLNFLNRYRVSSIGGQPRNAIAKIMLYVPINQIYWYQYQIIYRLRYPNRLAVHPLRH